MSETDQVTAALQRLQREQIAVLRLVQFVGGLVTRADDVAVIAAKALVEAAEGDERARLEATIEAGGAGVKKAMQEQHSQLFTRLALQRLVDNFLTYVAELLRLVFLTRPEALRSSETVRLDVVLRYASLEELVTFLVERRVERLTYLSVRDLARDLQETLGLVLFDDEDDLQRAVEVVAIRNLIAHNRGVVNARFLREVPDFDKEEGEDIFVTADYFFDAGMLLERVSRGVDARAVDHFGLPSVPDPRTES